MGAMGPELGHLTSDLGLYHLAAVWFIKCLVSRFIKLDYTE